MLTCPRGLHGRVSVLTGFCGEPKARTQWNVLGRASLMPAVTSTVGPTPTAGHVSDFVSLGFTLSLGFLVTFFRPLLGRG